MASGVTSTFSPFWSVITSQFSMETNGDTTLSDTTLTIMTDNQALTDIPTPPNIPRRRITLEDLLGQYWEYNLSEDLGVYGYPAIIGLGTLGNILTLLVMVKPSMRASSTCFYMAALAVFDTLVLYFACCRQWLALLQDSDWINLNSAACKTFNFFSYTCFDIAVWILVAVTLERFFVVHFPLKASKIATLPRARVILVVVCFLFIGFNLHFYWTVDLDERGFCTYTDGHEYFHENIWPWIDASVYSFLPFLLLLVLNIAIIYDIRKSLSTRNSTLNAQRTSSGRTGSASHSKLSAMLITVSVVFLLLSAPNVVLICIRDRYFDFTGSVPDLHDVAIYRLVATVTNFCLYLNHAVNFLLYCVSGERFRRELWTMLWCNWGTRRANSRTFSEVTTRSVTRLSESSAPVTPSTDRRENDNSYI